MKFTIFSIFAVLVIVLTACGSATAGTQASSAQADSELSLETQLAIGTLKLSGTDQDITLEQAEELIVLWQVYGEISQSDTAAKAELDGLIEQIQETMTSDQMIAITEMQLTQQDVFTAMQGSTVVTSVSQSTNSASIPSGGGMPAGGPPESGGGEMPVDFSGTELTVSGDEAQNAQSGSGLERAASVPSALVQVLIQSLEQKLSA